MPKAKFLKDDSIAPLIRRALPSDAPAIVQMVGRLARHHGDDPRVSLAGLEEDLFGSAPWIYALVAEQYGSLLGYALLCRVYRAQFGERGFDLRHLFVAEQARGAGLGKRLVKAALDEARLCRCAFLVVGTHPDNAAAQQFYESLGFERVAGTGPRFRLMIGR